MAIASLGPARLLRIASRALAASALLLFAVRGGADPLEPDSRRIEVGDIRVETRNIFDVSDPKENTWIFRTVNRIHVTTRPDFVLRAMPIAPGQRVTEDELREAERILRRFSFLREVKIEQVPREDGKVDLVIRTRDAWTTKIGLSFGGGGGESRFKVGAEETNLFGMGKSLGFSFTRTSVRTTQTISYRDPRFLDSNHVLELEYLDSSDGKGYRAEFELPLLRGVDPKGYRAEAVHLEEELPIYRDGEESSRVSRRIRSLEAEHVWTLSGSVNKTVRAGVALRPREERFEPVELARPDDLPADRDRADVLLLFRSRRLRFRSEAYINKFSRVEDIPTGLDFELHAGLSPKAFAGEENVWVAGGHLGGGFETFGGNFGTAIARVETRTGKLARNRTGLVDVEGIAYFRVPGLPSWNARSLVHVRSIEGWHLQPHERLLLGGDNGLRGYDAHSFDGDSLFLVNAEYRVSGEREYLRLVQVGAVAFVDAGTARDHDAINPKNWNPAIGFGLRFGIPRAASVNVLRLDVAYPLKKDHQGERGFVISFGSGQAF